MGQDAASFQRSGEAGGGLATLAQEVVPGGPGASRAEAAARDRVLDRIAGLVGEIDRRIHRQIEAVLHHERFQRLEASWRGLQYLVGLVSPGDNVLVRMLNVRWGELRRDFRLWLSVFQRRPGFWCRAGGMASHR